MFLGNRVDLPFLVDNPFFPDLTVAFSVAGHPVFRLHELSEATDTNKKDAIRKNPIIFFIL